MLRIRVAAVSAIAAFALTGLAQAAPADAHEYKVEGSPLTTYTNLQTEDSNHVLTFKGTPFGVSFQLNCASQHVTGGLETGGLSVMTVELNSCQLVKPAGCTFSSTTLQFKGKLGAEASDELSARSGTSIDTFILGGQCSIAGKPWEFSGTQTCVFPETGSEKAERELVCSIGGSQLKMGGKAATLETSIGGLHIANGLGEPTRQVWGLL
jgi:hypothetical protein